MLDSENSCSERVLFSVRQFKFFLRSTSLPTASTVKNETKIGEKQVKRNAKSGALGPFFLLLLQLIKLHRRFFRGIIKIHSSQTASETPPTFSSH